MDFMVVESLAAKARYQDNEARKEAERRQWRKEKNPDLEKLR